MAKKKRSGIKTAGVRELRDKLSQYLRELDQVEMLQVTDHGHVIALVVSPGKLAEASGGSREERERRELLAEGVFSRLGTQEKGQLPPPSGLGLSDAEFDEVMDFVRGDRDL